MLFLYLVCMGAGNVTGHPRRPHAVLASCQLAVPCHTLLQSAVQSCTLWLLSSPLGWCLHATRLHVCPRKIISPLMQV